MLHLPGPKITAFHIMILSGQGAPILEERTSSTFLDSTPKDSAALICA